MADKIAPGAWQEGAPARPAQHAGSGQRIEVERLQGRRDNARWSAVVGFGLLFGAGFHSGFLMGGILMILYGASASAYWSWRLRQLQGDPWDYDPDLDGPQAPAWAREGKPPPKHDADAQDLEDDVR